MKVTLHKPGDECFGVDGLVYCLYPDKCNASGKSIELTDLTQAQREECEDAVSILRHADGAAEFRGSAHSRNLWCQYGMNLNGQAEKLNDFSSEELMEIAERIRERALAGLDPTK